MDFLAKIKNIVRSAEITGPADNDQQFPVQQMSFKEKVVDVIQLYPYGMYSNISSGDSLGIMFSVDGVEETRMALSYTPQLRPTDLEQNEVSLYHPYTKTSIKLRNNGDLEITCNSGESLGKLIINCVDANINASGSVTLNTPETTLTGNLTVSGDTSLGAVVTSNGKDISDTHTHSGSATAPDGPISPTGAPV